MTVNRLPILDSSDLLPEKFLPAEVARKGDLVINVKDYGAIGDGIVDDTAAIENAFSISQSIFFPEGTFVYNGTGLKPVSTQFISVQGSGPNSGGTTISLGPSSYFIDTDIISSSMHVSKIRFLNGLGAIRSTYTGTNVSGFQIIEDCLFDGFTKTAIGNSASDFPYWKINRCQFFGDDSFESSIGVALKGLTDSVEITESEFLKCRVGVKLGFGGNNAHIENCGFLRFGQTNPHPRIDVWIEPNSNYVNAGPGFSISHTKFGNENLVSGDLRIAVADSDNSDPTVPWSEQHAKLDVSSVGYWEGAAVHNNMFSGSGEAGNTPSIFSTTVNVRNLKYKDNYHLGFDSNYLFFLESNLPTPDRLNSISEFSHNQDPFATETLVKTPVSNALGIGLVEDITDKLNTLPEYRVRPGGMDSTRFSKLLATGINAFTIGGGDRAVKTQVTDSMGGTDASEYVSQYNGFWYTGLTGANIKLGEPVWLEFDARKGLNVPALSNFLFYIQGSGNGPFHFRRCIPLQVDWVRYRFLLPGIRDKASLINFSFSSNGVAGSIQLGRCRAYHAREPLPERLMVADAITTIVAPAAGAGAALPATPSGYMTVNINGSLRKIAYY